MGACAARNPSPNSARNGATTNEVSGIQYRLLGWVTAGALVR
jgi:hypothetical protein